MVCTDWLVTVNEGSKPGIFKGETWGVEEYEEDFVESPHVHIDGGGYDMDDREQGGNGYICLLPYDIIPILRKQSIAAGDSVVDPEVTNRSYYGKTVTASNTTDLNTILTTRKKMGDKPVIAVINIFRPMIFSEFEPYVDAILLRFNINEQPAFDVISGRYEPSGLLPLQMPANMETVEKQNEDVPFDMVCYKDQEGHLYDFGFGMNWNGTIQDARTEKYRKVN